MKERLIQTEVLGLLEGAEKYYGDLYAEYEELETLRGEPVGNILTRRFHRKMTKKKMSEIWKRCTQATIDFHNGDMEKVLVFFRYLLELPRPFKPGFVLSRVSSLRIPVRMLDEISTRVGLRLGIDRLTVALR